MMKRNQTLLRISTRVSRLSERTALGLLVATTAMTAPVWASDAEPEFKLEEVIITAQRREEPLQTTPISVTALTADAMTQQNITTLSDISHVTPNLSISAAGYTAATNALPVIYIRGVGQQDPSIYSDPGVPVYVDGVYVARSAGGAIDLPDIERVEVLRGPQGTLFGKNAVGGAVNITTVTPGGKPADNLSVSGGNYAMYDFRNYMNLGSSSTLGAGFALNVHHQEGYGKLLSYQTGQQIGRMGDQDHLSARLRVHWELSDSFKLDLSGDYTKYRDTQAESQGLYIPFDPSGSPTGPGFLGARWNTSVHTPVPLSQAVMASGKYDSFATGPHGVRDALGGGSITATYSVRDMTFKSITAYRETDDYIGRDADGSPDVILETQRFMHSAQFTQEFQALGNAFDGTLSYIAGLYYLNDDSRQYDPTNVLQGLYQATLNPQNDVSRNYNDIQNTNSYAVFGQATYDFLSNLSATAGVRYTYEIKDAEISSYSPERNFQYVPPTIFNQSWTAFTPRVALDYQILADLMVYGSVSKGFKSGGFNGRPSNLASLSEFEPETAWSYELGMKSEWFDHRLRSNLAVFYADYKNIQLSRQVVIVVGGIPTLFSDVRNAARSTVDGFELELTAIPVQGLEIRAAAGYTYNEYHDIDPLGATQSAQFPVLPTSKIPYAPEKTASASVRYDIRLGVAGTLTPGVGYSYRSDTYSTPINSSYSRLPAYGLVDARLAYKPVSAVWELALYGKNLSNQRYLNSIGDSNNIGVVQQFWGHPREFGASINVRF